MEVFIEFLAIFFYIWYADKNSPDWFRSTFFWLICVGLPIACIGKDQKYFPEFSLDWNAFTRGLREILWFTLCGTALLVVIALTTQGFNYDGQILTRLPEYYFWSFLQQIGLQTFLTYRIQKIVKNPLAVSFVTASLFALLHWPNIALVSLTWIGGFFWSYSYQRFPNLYALSLSHAWLAVTSLYCLPPPWLHGLRIGPGYSSF